MNWIQELQIQRAVNRSNVFLVESDDPKRLQQLLALASKSEFLAKGGKQYKDVIEVDLQLGMTKIVRGNLPTQVSPRELVKIVTQKPVLVIMHWIITKAHADKLIDILAGLSQNPDVYTPKSERESLTPPFLPSTIIVFTFNTALFPINVRKLFAEVSVLPSTPEERRKIIETLKQELEQVGYHDIKVSSDAVVSSAGLNLHEVETAVLESVKLRNRVDAETFRKYKVTMLKKLGLEYIEPKYGFNAVGGYDYIKTFLKKRIINFYKNPELSKMYGVRNPRGILLFGLPGTGKSWMARALAKEMGLPMVSINASDLLRGIVGESEQRAKKITKILESMSPIVVFIDEADQLFQSRGQVMSTDSGVFRRVQNILLEWLGDEDRKSFIVMATNYLEQFDFASVRSGRIDYGIPVMLPNLEARVQILKLHTEVLSKPSVTVDVNYDEIAKITSGFTGAELRQVTETAKIIAAEEKRSITTKYFIKATESIKINKEERMEQVKSMFEQAKKVSTVIIPFDLDEIIEKEEYNVDNPRIY